MLFTAFPRDTRQHSATSTKDHRHHASICRGPYLESVLASVISHVRVVDFDSVLEHHAVLGPRGFHSKDIKIIARTFTASLARSKTIGSDRDLVSGPSSSMPAALSLVRSGSLSIEFFDGVGPFSRKLELRYDASHAIQNRVLRFVEASGRRMS